jgi:malate permease and related proteins
LPSTFSLLSSYFVLLAAVAPVFLTIGSGWFIRRIGWLTEEADASLLRVVVNLLFPCLILDTILGNRALEHAGNILLAPVVGFGTVALGYALCLVAAPMLGLRDTRSRRTFAFTTGIYNYGYVPLPLIAKLFDQQTTAVLFIHNLGVETALWTLGIMLISGASPRAAWTRVFNAPVVTIVLAVALHFAGAREWMPSFILNAVHGLGAAAVPLGLILTGATFADQLRGISFRNSTADSIGAVVLRLAILPVVFLAIARWLPCPAELRRVIIIQAAMPCAVIPVILCKHYNGDPALALRIILLTTAIALLTIPVWIQLGLHFVGG